jgi:DNA-binding NtrC family response regulator
VEPKILILDQNSSPCAADKCSSIPGLLQRSFAASCTHAYCKTEFPETLARTSDLIVLRTSGFQIGTKLIAECKRKRCGSPVLLIFCSGVEQKLPNQLFLDYDDFSYCPFHEGELLSRVSRLLNTGTRSTLGLQNVDSAGTLHFGALVGKNLNFLQAVANIRPLAQCDATVLVYGETGTGKELFSRAIHYQSARQGKPFIPVNCAALPDHLFENELFGHIRGAYTDASSAEKGLIAEAQGGTLVLDEVGSLGLAAQGKLLRFLQDGEYRPLGASRNLISDVRIIAATNEDLLHKVRVKLFREDLYFRLNSLSVSIPPLRERIEDIALLANYFLRQYARDHGQEPRRISESALHKLVAYHWPGNVRELEGVILRAMILTDTTNLQPQDIHLPTSGAETLSENTSLRVAKMGIVQSFERTYLVNLLTAHRGNVTQAAKAAGKQRRTLQRLLEKYSLNRQSFEC